MKASRFFAATLAAAMLFAIAQPPFLMANAAEDAPLTPKVVEVPVSSNLPEVETPTPTAPETTEPPKTTESPATTESPETTDPPETTPDPEITEPPSTITRPAAFSIKLLRGATGAQIRGIFSGYTPDMVDIQSLYSLDGMNFSPVGEGYWGFNPESTSDGNLENTVANQNQSPLQEYLAGTVDTFFIRLKYKTPVGEKLSKIARFTRPTQAVPVPEGVDVFSLYPARMKSGRAWQYNLTVGPDATREDILALLPTELPVELQVLEDSDVLAVVSLTCPVEWDLPAELSPKDIQVPNAIRSLTMPEELEVETLNAIYAVQAPEVPPMPLTLRLNWIGAEEQPSFDLHVAEEEWKYHPPGTLFLDLPLKPSGAQAIRPAYSLDGGETWVQTTDLLDYNEPVDEWPKNPDYRYAALYTPQQSPYREYLAGEIEGFLVRLDITGGPLAGQSETVSFPRDYVYEPPDKDSGSEGAGGNGGNIGSDTTDGDSGENGGQRPGLPEQEPVPILEPTPSPSATPTPTATPVPTSTQPPVPTPEPDPTPSSIPSPASNVDPTPSAQPSKVVMLPEQTPEPTEEATPEPSQQPSPSPSEKATIPPRTPAPTPEQTLPEPPPEPQPERDAPLPAAAVALTVVAGGGIAIFAGTSTAGAAGTSGLARMISAIKRLFGK